MAASAVAGVDRDLGRGVHGHAGRDDRQHRFPRIERSFSHDSLGDLSWVLNAYNIVFAAALVPAGRLADRLGRKRLFLVGVVLFVTASVVCGLAGSLGVLVAARVVQAMAGAVLLPTSLSLALPEFPVTQRATATSLWTATGAVAAATGPSLGGFLTSWLGWPAVFFVNLVIGLPMRIPARRLLRESRDQQGRLPDFLGAAMVAGAVAAVALAMVKGQGPGGGGRPRCSRRWARPWCCSSRSCCARCGIRSRW